MAHHLHHRPGLYGLMAEFKDAAQLLEAAHRTYRAGYRHLDAYSPFPVHGLAEAIGKTDRKVQLTVLIGGICGLLGGFGLAYYTSAIETVALPGMFSGYALNIGGRPLNSWPAFIVPTFETTVLLAGLTALISMLVFNGLPMPYHPVFNVARFREHASTDAFFLAIEATDPKFDTHQTRHFLKELGAMEVNDVAH
jgi:hypothetical protein